MRRPRTRPVAAATLLALAVACAPHRRWAPAGPDRYTVGEPGEGWRRVRPGGADFAWYNEALGATIYADANCGRRFEDSELEALVAHQLAGIGRGAPRSEERAQVDGRAALAETWEGELDGVAVLVGAFVTKQHGCSYDVTLVAPPGAGADALEAWRRAWRGLHVEER